MKSEAFFKALPVRAAEPVSNAGPKTSVASVLVLLLVLAAIAVTLKPQHLHSPLSLAGTAAPIEQEAFLQADQRKPIYDLSVTRDSESMFFRSIAGELYHLDYSGEAGQLLTSLFPNRYCVKFVLSPDRSHLIASFLDGSVIRRSLDPPADQRFLREPSSQLFELLAFSPDGKLLAYATRRGDVFVVEVESRRTVASLHKQTRVTSLVFDSERGMLISSDAGLERWIVDPQQGASKQPVFDWKIEDHYQARQLVVTPDGQYLISSSYDGVFSVRDLRRGGLIWEQKGTFLTTRGLTLSPDAESFCCYSAEKTLIEYDLLTGEVLSRYEDPEMGPGSGASYSERGDLIFTASSDGFIRIWSTRDSLMFGRIDTADLL